MTNLSVKFEDVVKLSITKLKALILDERDNISKNWIAKLYRQHGYNDLNYAYEIYYRSKLWKECIRPLLIAYGINSGKYRKTIGENYECICGNITNHEKLVPHHTSYPQLAKKYKYRGFDDRIKLNHPERILFVCNKCHEKIHE